MDRRSSAGTNPVYFINGGRMGLEDEERLLLLDPGTASGTRPRHTSYGASYNTTAMTGAGTTPSPAAAGSANTAGAGCKDNDRWPRPKKVSYWKLFRYATAQDIVLLFLGTVFAILHGAGWPLLAIVFGHMTNAFIHQQQAGFYDGDSTNFTTLPPPQTFGEAIRRSGAQSMFDPVTILEYNITMNKFALTYVIIAAVVFVSSFIHVWCWTRACDRQLYRLRQELFYSILRQDAAWFDRHRVTEVASRMNDDMERLREGMGDKMGLFIHYLSTFASGFATGFVESWELTLVIMSVTPLLAFATAFLDNMVSQSAAKEQEKCAQAEAVALEVLSKIRTVAAFCFQYGKLQRYMTALEAGKTAARRM